VAAGTAGTEAVAADAASPGGSNREGSACGLREALEGTAAKPRRRAHKTMKSWSKGDRVTQPNYGAGTLVEVNEHHTVIDFDEHGRRTFSTRLVVLQATSEPAPHKAATKKRAPKKKKEDS
jgi:hypothetical protein